MIVNKNIQIFLNPAPRICPPYKFNTETNLKLNIFKQYKLNEKTQTNWKSKTIHAKQGYITEYRCHIHYNIKLFCPLYMY